MCSYNMQETRDGSAYIALAGTDFEGPEQLTKQHDHRSDCSGHRYTGTLGQVLLVDS